MSEPWVPTVDDLRVKMCYICREEERYDCPTEAKTAWTHPCQCTLVAHESCLLHWIQSSQQTRTRADKAFKCPQCAATYEIESHNPITLRLLEALNKKLTYVGRLVTAVGLGTTIATFGLCIYFLCTSYGAWAVREYLGKEMFDLILTDDPNNWPWHAFINVPLIPFSLLISRTLILENPLPPFITLFLNWPMKEPVSKRNWLGRSTVVAESTFPSIFKWPPVPFVATILFPVTQTIYRRLFSKFQHWVLDTKPTPVIPAQRVIWNLNQDRGVNVEILLEQGRRGRDAQGQANAGEEGQENPADAAARTINVNNASVGRRIGGVLIIPKISNVMGSLLFSLSKRSLWLRRFLAVKPPLNKTLARYIAPTPVPITNMRTLGRILVNTFLGETNVWRDADPVWWRNSLGLGIFVIIKDCVGLLHLYLAKRELQSRRVKNRSFKGIDYRELDLINPLPQT